MSYDLDLYVGKSFELTPPDAGDGGQFALDPPARLESEDIPEVYQTLIGKRRRWLVRVYIEGQPDRQALLAFDRWLADVVAETNGVLIDEQAGRFLTAKADGALPDPASSKTSGADDPANWGQMSFFFEDHEAFVPDKLPQVLQVISDVLPEALPARWGQYEPLQGKVEGGNVTPLIEAFRADPDQFMRAKAPFAFIYSNIASKAELKKWHPNHFLKRHYLAGHLCFDLRPKALELPRLVEGFWEISKTLDVFYSEIRDHECPVRAWFWQGIPPGPVRAFALGPPYTHLWETARKHAVDQAGDTILVAPTRLDPGMPEPPSDLRDPGEDFVPHGLDSAIYAKTFPFKVPNVR